ncbi:CMRF35-like molecule 8 isoform X2 [Kogia breviceps]|uniref:CMRF35-like molecule 8 isoform X2 n=1 Tax=Kogia breviceps TaxID=27615 RepID=UPI0034D1CA7F
MAPGVLQSLFMITSCIANCLEISPIPSPSSLSLIHQWEGRQGGSTGVRASESRGLEDDADCSWLSLTRSTTEDPCEEKMTLPLLFFLLCRLAGSSDITGPKAISSREGGSLTVQCRYSPRWQNHVKWWCRGAAWSSCKIIVETTGSEKEVKEGRVSISDNWKHHTMTVTMEELRLSDADTYWCGIERFATDLGVQVKVSIEPVTISLEETSGSPAVTSPGSNNGGVFLKTSLLLPLILAVVLLLLMVASLVVWRTVKQQKKAAGISPEQVRESPRSEQRHQTLSLTSLFSIFQEHRGPNVPDKPRAQVSVYSWPSCEGRGRGPVVCWNQPEGKRAWEGEMWETKRRWGSQGSREPRVPPRKRNRCSVFALLGASAPGGRHLLRKPEPAAGRKPWILPEGFHGVLFLHPGQRGGSGVCHHGSLSQGGHCLCSPVFGNLRSRANL